LPFMLCQAATISFVFLAESSMAGSA